MIIKTDRFQPAKIDNYYANLYKFGYYLEKRDTNPYIELSSNKKIVIQSISSDIASNDYIMRLFEILCKENHPIIKFHILYQVVEFYFHKVSFCQSLQNPIAAISTEGNRANKLAIFSLKLLPGETNERKYRIIHNR